MSNNNPINEKKKALLAYKEKILEEIQYYEKRIDEFPTNQRNNCYYDDADSSDSEDYFPNSIDTGPDVGQLKLQQAMFKTCLQATQELTSLTVLQSEINVLVQDPELNGESPVKEPGTWKEVTAECRIDLVPFTITFYMHTPDRKFAPTSYRGLQVSLVKTSHEVELNNSVLHTIKKPGDAVEVVRSYAAAYRSRRTTLARLANKYAGSLFMEPHPEGGFVLKCANLLEILWRLENKWSPVAPFHHRMKFDIEYMDESYIKIITQAHKQLLDPSIQTDERSLLLAKIINTCLTAKGPLDSESDLESRQTDMRTETESKDKDSEVMAPPKSLPKKTKKMMVKDKDVNKDNSAPQKRSAEGENDGGNTKKIKTGEESNSGVKERIFKAREKSGDNKNSEISKKDKNTNVDNKGNKKKHNENADVIKQMKKTKNNDKVEEPNKENNQNNHVNIVPMANNDNINENNKTETNKIIAKKKNNDKGSEITKANKNDNKELKKMKSNEEIKRKNVQTGESIVTSAANVNENNTGTNKTVAKKKNNNDKGSEITKANENYNKAIKKMKSNEEINRKNVQTGESIMTNEHNIIESNKNIAKKKDKNDNGPEMTKANKNINKELKMKSNEEIIRKTGQTDENNVIENNKNIAKKRKNNDNDPEMTQANKNEKQELKKTKSNEEIKRKNVDTGESNPKKAKSSSDINKPDKKLTKNCKKSESGSNKVTSNIGDEGSKKERVNDVIKNKESEIIVAKTSISTEKNKNINSDDIQPKKLDRKTKISIANDKKFDQITKKVFGSNEKKMNNKMTKTLEKNQRATVASAKDTNENKKSEVVAINKKAELQKILEKKTVAIPKNVELQKNVNKPDQIKTFATKKDANENKKTRVVPNKKSAEHQTKEKKIAAIPKNAESQNNANKPELMATEQNKNPGNTKGLQAVKTVTEKNANNIKNTDNITNVNTVIEKPSKDKPRINTNKPEKIVSGSVIAKNNIINKKLPKITTQNVRNINHKSPRHQNLLKVQNSQKTVSNKMSNGNTQVLSSKTEKENGGKISKIPQKKISMNSDTSVKTNMLRISPRRLPSKFKTISQEINAKQFTKSTNIPRFLKKTSK